MSMDKISNNLKDRVIYIIIKKYVKFSNICFNKNRIYFI